MIYLANDNYSGQLRTAWVSDPADGSMAVNAIPANFPCLITLGFETDYEAVFEVTGYTGTGASNYALTGVTWKKGYVGDQAINSTINCLINEEYFNQFVDSVVIVDPVTGDYNLIPGANITVDTEDPYRTIILPAGSMNPTTTAGCADVTTVETSTNKINYKVLDYDTTTEEHAFANFAMPTSWDGGVIQFRVNWTAASGSGGVTFGLAGRSFGDDDAIDQALGTEVNVSDTLITAVDEHLTAWSGDVTLAGTPAGGEHIYLELARKPADGGDTLGVDARVISLQLRYKIAQYSD